MAHRKEAAFAALAALTLVACSMSTVVPAMDGGSETSDAGLTEMGPRDLGVDLGPRDLGVDLGPPDLGGMEIPADEPPRLALSVLNTFALLGDGSFASAGSNLWAQRGAPRTSSASGLSFELYTGGAATFAALAATQFAGFGISTSGRLYSWGTNARGVLGAGISETTYVQAMPSAIGGAADLWRSVDGGDRHVCGIRQSGVLACWGDREDGPLGVGATTGEATSPVDVDATTDWSRVSAGLSHTCAIKLDGSLWCWGSNGGSSRSGQLGLGDHVSRSTPTRVGTATDWSRVSAGNAHTCAVKTTGALFCWGEASIWGRLGVGMGVAGPGADGDVREPAEVTVPAVTWENVAAGQFHTCAIATGGDLYCWGVGTRGALGLGMAEADQQASVPTLVSSGWAEVAVGWSHTCGRRTDDSLLCWGQIDDGRTGTGVDPSTALDLFEPTPVIVAR